MPHTSLKHIPEPILWHEGMLLTPEHFDELTSRQEELLQYHLASHAFNWGVSHVLFDEAQLLQGRIALLELEALMPDGMLLWLDRKTEAHAEIDLEALDQNFRQSPWLLYLATVAPEGAEVRRQRYTPAESEDPVSLSSTTRQDEDVPILIPRLKPRFQLIPSQTPLSSRFVSMPVARIAFRNGTWIFAEDYLPPVRRVEETSLVGRRCMATLRRVREFAIASGAKWRGMSARERAESRGLELETVRSLAATLPHCEAMLSSQAIHPFSLYLSFCSLAGHVAGLAVGQVPPVFPAYRHDDVLGSFTEIERYILGVLEETDTSRYQGFPFSFSEGVFSINFVPEWFGRPMVLALQGQRENDPTLIAWAEQALIGSRSQQAGMRGRRVLGAQRRLIEERHELFAGLGTVLFSLEEDREFLLGDEPLDVASGPASGNGGMPSGITLYVLQSQ